MFTKGDSAYFPRVAAKSSTKRAMRSGSSKWPQCPDFSSHSSLQSHETADAQKVSISVWLRQCDKPGKAPAALPPKHPQPRHDVRQQTHACGPWSRKQAHRRRGSHCPHVALRRSACPMLHSPRAPAVGQVLQVALRKHRVDDLVVAPPQQQRALGDVAHARRQSVAAAAHERHICRRPAYTSEARPEHDYALGRALFDFEPRMGAIIAAAKTSPTAFRLKQSCA